MQTDTNAPVGLIRRPLWGICRREGAAEVLRFELFACCSQNLHIVFRDEASFPVQLALQPARLSGMGHCRVTAQERADGGHHASTSPCARSDRVS